MGGQSFSCGTNWGPGQAQEVTEVSRALLQEIWKLRTGSIGHIMVGLVESSVGSQSHGGMVAVHPGGSPGSALGCTAGVIKPGRVVLAVLVGVMLA